MTAKRIEHPRYYIALKMRSKKRTLNIAVALKGRSSGWGRGGRPRRTFIGHHRGRAYHRGFEVVWHGPGATDSRTLLKIRTGSGHAA
jgi:hypothetical protein